MRRALPIVLAASLTLGAAPPPDSALAECRLPYDQAVAALGRLRVRSHEDFPGEDEYRHKRQYDPSQLTAFGFPARAGRSLKVDAISHEVLVVVTTLDAGYAQVRAAALASRGKRACTPADDSPGDCRIEEREQGGWTVTFDMANVDGHPDLACVYMRTGS